MSSFAQGDDTGQIEPVLARGVMAAPTGAASDLTEFLAAEATLARTKETMARRAG